MKKDRWTTKPSKLAKQIFNNYKYSIEKRAYIETIIKQYSESSYPYRKIVAMRLAKKLHRADIKEFGYPIKAQTKANFSYFSKIYSY